MAKQKIKATCHCGNITLKASYLPKKVARCNCSICNRYGALWGYYTPNEVKISYKKEKSVFYIWGDKEVEFHRCNTCGCLTHYITTPKCNEEILALNMNMIESTLLNNLLKHITIKQINGILY